MYKRLLPSESLVFAPDRFDRGLVRDFLFVFARAEYALKASGFVRGGRYGEPKIEWRAFASSLGAALLGQADAEVDAARTFLIEHPPRKQIVHGQRLVWVDRAQRPDQSQAEFLIESATQVRHNLFHGGKELVGRLAERDRALVHAAMVVTAFAISIAPGVAMTYQDAGPSGAVA